VAEACNEKATPAGEPQRTLRGKTQRKENCNKKKLKLFPVWFRLIRVVIEERH
jgi:hypothetical protein